MENKQYYGIKVEYNNGDVFYFGKEYSTFLKSNVLTGETKIIDGKQFACVNLDKGLIAKNGFSNRNSCEKAKENYKFFVGYDEEGKLAGKVDVVELNTFLYDKVNRSFRYNTRTAAI